MYQDNLEEILTKISFSKYEDIYVTPEQLHKLLALSFDENTPFFSYESKNGILNVNDSAFLYDFLSMRIDKEYSIDEIIKEIEEIIELHNYTKKNYNFILFKTGDFFNNEDEALQEDLKRIKGNISILGSGFVKCPDCKSDRTISIGVQTRGGDEGTDTFNECYACGKKWRIRG